MNRASEGVNYQKPAVNENSRSILYGLYQTLSESSLPSFSLSPPGLWSPFRGYAEVLAGLTD